MRVNAMNAIRSLARNTRGTTIVEFAMILTPLLMLLMGAIELGHMSMARSTVEGALREAARMATTGNSTSANIDTFIKGRVQMVSGARVTIVKKAYDDFEQVNRPEPLTSDVAPIGQFNPGDCFRDLNENAKWDTDSGSSGLGGAEDIIYYEVTLDYPPLFPFMKVVPGFPDSIQLSANTVLRNEPYAKGVNFTPKIICTS